MARPLVIIVGTVLLCGVIFLVAGYLAETFTRESTDDAFLDADYVSLSPRISGQVAQVYVSSNQKVHAGEAIAEIDPRDFQVQVDQKQAALKSAQANVDLLLASVELFRTQIGSAEATAKQSAAEAAASQATADRANADLKRAQELIANHTISPQEFDATRAVATAAEASLRASQEKAASDRSKVEQAKAQLEAGIKAYQRAQAQTGQAESDLRAAELNLSYTHLTAPLTGYVTKKAVSEGDYVQAGQKLMALVPENFYVTANFKETQLQAIRTNMPVRIRIDALKQGPFRGHVQSIMAGSGARFSLLPPENAVGNYIKVVQRVPVKILFDDPVDAGHVLGPGMSVVPSVKISNFELSETARIAIAVIFGLVVGVYWWAATRTARMV